MKAAKIKKDKKEKKLFKKHSVSSDERMSTKIIADFVRFNLFCFALLWVIYIIIYLSALQFPAFLELIRDIIGIFFSEDMTAFILNYSYIFVISGCFVVFVVTCFAYSVSTLINFDKTWLSLSAILSDEKQVKKFSQSYSDIEIKLKDIKHDVFKKEQIAASAEMRKNDLVMYLAHDLKTPLTSVIGYLSLLNDCPEIPTEQRAKYIGITLDKAYRLEQLINEFFEITRFNLNSITLEKNRIDIGMMLYQIADEFYPMLIEKNIEIKVDMKDKIVIYADSDKIARVFDNLIKNAVNYCYSNSTIAVGARIVGDNVIIKFRNHCDEIPKEKIEKLFDKFFRLDSARSSSTGGSGLGLAISKQIVELHGGKITAKSTRDFTDFTVIIPYIDASGITEI